MKAIDVSMRRSEKGLSLAKVLTVLVLAWFVLPEAGLRLSQRYWTYTEKNGDIYQSRYAAYWAVPWPQPAWFPDLGVNAEWRMSGPEFDYLVRTNSDGVRDVEHPIPKPADEIRIVAIGDEMTSGLGAAFEDSYPQALERRLNERAQGVRHRVLNAGVGGHDPVYSYQLLRRRLLKYDPDLVILLIRQYQIDRLITRGGPERFGPGGRVIPKPAPGIEPFYEASHLVRAFAHTYLDLDHLLLAPEERTLREEEALPLLAEAIVRFQELGEAEGFDFVVAALPSPHHVRFETAPNELAALEPTLRERGVAIAETFDAMRGAIEPDRIDDYWWPLSLKPRARGYALLADVLGAELERLGVVPEAAQPIGG